MDQDKKPPTGSPKVTPPPAVSPKGRQPTADEIAYDRLVKTKTSGWDEKKVKAHKAACRKALAKKRGEIVSGDGKE